MSKTIQKNILVVSRCAWTLYNFRAGLMKGLIAKGHKVRCAGAEGDGFEKRLREEDFDFIPIPVDRRGINPLADLRLLFHLFFLYRKLAPDVVLHFTIKPVIYGSVAARLAGVPRIVNTITGLGYAFTGRQSGWLKRIVMPMYRAAISSAHFTFFQNSEDRDFFVSRNLARPENTGVLPGSGVDCDRFRPRPEALDGDRPVILMVARLLEDKGVREFAGAARMVREKRPEARFVILGRRDERNPSVIPEKEIASWIDEGVLEWPGETDDVRPWLAKARIVALPSYREGTPRSLLEASAMAKPIVAADVPGCRDVVDHGKTGLLVPVRDAKSLAEAVSSLLENPGLCGEMGAAGREKMLARYDEKSVISMIAGAFEKPSKRSR
ncbi:MAG: glycosyltransferase family 4 protein [Deltaproteobacteria bacterium]|nr:glycosyltransferase family 4 protein [Deltaproteobacteria bacterium]